jgi:hypothetical protein
VLRRHIGHYLTARWRRVRHTRSVSATERGREPASSIHCATNRDRLRDAAPDVPEGSRRFDLTLLSRRAAEPIRDAEVAAQFASSVPLLNGRMLAAARRDPGDAVPAVGASDSVALFWRKRYDDAAM